MNCSSLPVLCINFEGENPLYVQITAPVDMDMIKYKWHTAFWFCKTHWTPLFQVKTAPFFWESLTGSSFVHILLQPYDLLNDLKINNKLIYSALYETYLSIWDIIWYKTLKSWPAPRSQLQSAECTKFLGPQVPKTMSYKWQSACKPLDNLFFHRHHLNLTLQVITATWFHPQRRTV